MESLNVKLLGFIIRPTLFVALIVAFNPIHAQATKKDEINWYGWTEGYEKGNNEGKIMLIDAYTDWCGWCKRMDRDTYSNPDVISFINKHFIAIKFNPEIENVTYDVDGQKVQGGQLYYMLTQGQSHGFPTTYFLLPKQKSMLYDQGYRNSTDFLELLKKVIEESKKQP
jgi:uncharacterized protein YyaL (SSP411 family)